MSGSCICAICYEDVDPASELLQAIALCGHVFHELCLQQWVEFCPKGRAPTCPLCKQHCAAKDVHRLYFQSVSDSSYTKKDATHQSSRKKSPSERGQPSADDQSKLWRLEAKVTMLTAECKASKEKILQVEGEGQRNLEQLRLVEAEKLKVRIDQRQLFESLDRTREELRKTSKHREELLERNEAMAKDLAVYKLASDVNLSEIDVSRLISPPNVSSSKDDIIDMMRKALFLQNKNFKDLMHKCQELGIGESRAEQKCEKMMEQVKRMKARMQEMAKAEEEKGNAAVRSLTSRARRTLASGPIYASESIPSLSRPHPNSKQVGEREKAARVPLASDSGPICASESIPSLSRPHPNSKQVGERKKAARVPLASESPDAVCLDSDPDSPEAQVRWTKDKTGLVVGSSDMVRETPRSDGDFNLRRKSRKTYSQPGAIQSAEPHSQSSGAQTTEDPSARTTVEQWSDEEGFYRNVGSSGSQGRPKLTIGLDGDIDNVDALRRPVLPIRQELGLGQAAASFTRPQSATGYQMPATTGQAVPPESRFILSGADGRGGRVRVLKPPKLVPGWESSYNVLGVTKGKSFKPTSHIAGTRSSMLKIEHFFGRG